MRSTQSFLEEEIRIQTQVLTRPERIQELLPSEVTGGKLVWRIIDSQLTNLPSPCYEPLSIGCCKYLCRTLEEALTNALYTYADLEGKP